MDTSGTLVDALGLMGDANGVICGAGRNRTCLHRRSMARRGVIGHVRARDQAILPAQVVLGRRG